jgi:hypothetical protein
MESHVGRKKIFDFRPWPPKLGALRYCCVEISFLGCKVLFNASCNKIMPFSARGSNFLTPICDPLFSADIDLNSFKSHLNICCQCLVVPSRSAPPRPFESRQQTALVRSKGPQFVSGINQDGSTMSWSWSLIALCRWNSAHGLGLNLGSGSSKRLFYRRHLQTEFQGDEGVTCRRVPTRSRGLPIRYG